MRSKYKIMKRTNIPRDIPTNGTIVPTFTHITECSTFVALSLTKCSFTHPLLLRKWLLLAIYEHTSTVINPVFYITPIPGPIMQHNLILAIYELFRRTNS